MPPMNQSDTWHGTLSYPDIVNFIHPTMESKYALNRRMVQILEQVRQDYPHLTMADGDYTASFPMIPSNINALYASQIYSTFTYNPLTRAYDKPSVFTATGEPVKFFTGPGNRNVFPVSLVLLTAQETYPEEVYNKIHELMFTSGGVIICLIGIVSEDASYFQAAPLSTFYTTYIFNNNKKFGDLYTLTGESQMTPFMFHAKTKDHIRFSHIFFQESMAGSELEVIESQFRCNVGSIAMAVSSIQIDLRAYIQQSISKRQAEEDIEKGEPVFNPLKGLITEFTFT